MSDYAELVFDLRMMDRYTTHKAADAIEAQAARIAELEAALTPFAKFCATIDEAEARMSIPRSPDEKEIHKDLTVGAFRGARAVLEDK